MPVLDELAKYLAAQGVGVVSQNIFYGSHAVIPTGAGPYLTLVETGGMSPIHVQNQMSPVVQQPTVQLAVRAKTYNSARTMLKAAYDVLAGLSNTTLSGTLYINVIARQEPTDIGLDDLKRPVIVFNIEVQKQPS